MNFLLDVPLTVGGSCSGDSEEDSLVGDLEDDVGRENVVKLLWEFM